MADQESVSVLLSNAYESLRSVDLAAATDLLDRALAADYEHEEVLYSLKCSNFWVERLSRLSSMQNPFERGEYVMGQWKGFMAFSSKLGGDFERARYAFKRFAFSLALQQYRLLPPEENESHEAELALRMGRCLKGSGDFDSALKCLESAAQARKDDAEVLAELADTYALSGDSRSSKALFREAFYLGAQRIDLDFLESEMIVRLVGRVTGLGYSGPELAEWLPVYACLYGVFNVKRELKAVEAGKLRQSIYQLENELKENQGSRAELVPRLINRYFWLIDYYMAVREDRAKIEEILLKIRLLDVSVYKQYTA
jgi:tetratricopeptide (TPR) repeat protein